jgi:hypothetical protein
MMALAAWMVMADTAHSSEITDLYSSIDSADVTLEGDMADMALRLDLIDEGRLIMIKNLNAVDPGTRRLRLASISYAPFCSARVALLWIWRKM